jgi:hypothetical protein
MSSKKLEVGFLTLAKILHDGWFFRKLLIGSTDTPVFVARPPPTGDTQGDFRTFSPPVEAGLFVTVC